MSWIEIMWIVGSAISILLLVCAYRVYRAKRSDMKEDITVIALIIGVILVICIAVNFSTYNSAVSIPYEYRAMVKDVDDIETYLMRYENISDEGFGSIGQGLESLEYKQELQQAIKDRNEREAEICALLNNVWTPYKEILIRGLPSGDYGRVIISEDNEVRVIRYG